MWILSSVWRSPKCIKYQRRVGLGPFRVVILSIACLVWSPWCEFHVSVLITTVRVLLCVTTRLMSESLFTVNMWTHWYSFPFVHCMNSFVFILLQYFRNTNSWKLPRVFPTIQCRLIGLQYRSFSPNTFLFLASLPPNWGRANEWFPQAAREMPVLF